MSEIVDVEYTSCGKVVKTIFLGDGSTGISSLTQEHEKLTGIAFSAIDKVEIGTDQPEAIGKPITESEVLIQVLSSSRESLVVLRNAVISAIKSFDLIEPKYTPDTDHQTAAEMDAISTMLSESNELTCEVIYSLLLSLNTSGKDIADECNSAVLEWIK